MVKEIYSCGCYIFESAKDLVEFKTLYPNNWDIIKDKALKLSILEMDDFQDFVDYLDSLRNMPDICLAYRADNARGHGYYTTVWCNNLEIRGIFGYHESDDISDHILHEIISLTKWAGMKIRQNNCR